MEHLKSALQEEQNARRAAEGMSHQLQEQLVEANSKLEEMDGMVCINSIKASETIEGDKVSMLTYR